MPEVQHIQELCQGRLSLWAVGMLVSAPLSQTWKETSTSSSEGGKSSAERGRSEQQSISERCSITVNHCCVQASELMEEQEGREQGEEGTRGMPSCSAHDTSAESHTAPQEQ